MNNNIKIIEKPEWGKYVSTTSDNKIPPYYWYNFKHSFGSELVAKFFELFGLQKGATILDPFCGGGTTLIKAKIDGYNAVGLDISPFSIFITNALTKKYDEIVLNESLSDILNSSYNEIIIPHPEVLYKAFTKDTLNYIFALKKAINSLETKNGKNFFHFILFSIINDISKLKKSGGFLRNTNQRKQPRSFVRKLFTTTAEKLIHELADFSYTNSTTKAMLGDARSYPKAIKTQMYDAIITSPPYPNRHDYTRIYELELQIGFYDDSQLIKNLRYDTLRSHVEAKKKYDAVGYKIPKLLEEKIEKLKLIKLNNTKLLSTLSGYFEDMYLCLGQMASVLKRNGHIGLVVSNVKFGGVMIPVDQILAEIGEQVGLTTMAIYALRYRGNSPQQMYLHSREPSRESVIVWQKE